MKRAREVGVSCVCELGGSCRFHGSSVVCKMQMVRREFSEWREEEGD